MRKLAGVFVLGFASALAAQTPSYLACTGSGTSRVCSTNGALAAGTTVPESINDGCPKIADRNNICVKAAPYFASGSSTTTATSASAAPGTISLSVASCLSFDSTGAANQYGHQGVYIAGAGPSGAQYIGTISACVGTLMTVAPAISTSIASGALVQHDDTHALQSAINAAASSTSGNVYLPIGYYRANGPLQDTSGANAILTMPQVTYGSEAAQYVPGVSISIEGGSEPTEGCVAGCTVIATQAPAGNLIGGQYVSAPQWSPWTYVYLNLDKLSLRSYDNPNVTLVNATYIAGLTAKHVWCDTGDYVGWEPGQRPTVPTHPNGACILAPTINNGVTNIYEDVWSYGQYTGLTLTEHARVISAYALFDYNAFSACNAGNPAVADMLWAQNSVHTLAATCPANIAIGMVSSENATTSDVYDPSNYLIGPVNLWSTSSPPVIVGGVQIAMSQPTFNVYRPSSAGGAMVSYISGANPVWQAGLRGGDGNYHLYDYADLLDMVICIPAAGCTFNRAATSGAAKTSYSTGGATAANWQTGLSVGDNSYHVVDVSAGSDVITCVPGGGCTVRGIDDIWSITTPVPTASSGTLTSASSHISTNITGKTAKFNADVLLTSVGTGSGSVQVTMPFVANSFSSTACYEHGATGNTGTGYMTAGASVLTIAKYGGGAVTSGYDWNCTGTFQTQ